MQTYHKIVISEQDINNLDLAIKYRQQIIDFVNAGQSGIVIFFSNATKCPEQFLDILFRELILQNGSTWFINSYIMIDADSDSLKKEISNFVIDALQSTMQNEMNTTSIETPLINGDNWQQLPGIKGKVATEEDYNNGESVFYINSDQSKVNIIDIELPQCAIWTNENNEQIPVVIVQAEQVENQQLVGMYSLEGSKIVAQLTEVEFVSPEILFGSVTTHS